MTSSPSSTTTTALTTSMAVIVLVTATTTAAAAVAVTTTLLGRWSIEADPLSCDVIPLEEKKGRRELSLSSWLHRQDWSFFRIIVGSSWFVMVKPQIVTSQTRNNSSTNKPSNILLLWDSLFLGLLLTGIRNHKRSRNVNVVESSKQEKEPREESTKKRRTLLPTPPSPIPIPTVTPTPLFQIQQQKLPPKQQQRYLEILVHNVSHTDLILSLEAPRSSATNFQEQIQEEEYCLCRPRFSAFHSYTQRILESLNSTMSTKHSSNINRNLIHFPRYERYPRDQDALDPSQQQQPPPNITPTGSTLPVGFALESNQALQVTSEKMNDLRIRGQDAPRLAATEGTTVSTRLNAVFFPLLAMLLSQWETKLIPQKYDHSSTVKKVLILVSGVGSPRNWTHSPNGNSTAACALLMKRFVETLYDDIVVVPIHSSTNIFRYDENIQFVQTELLPTIQSYRDAHAKGLPYPDEMTPDKISASDASFSPEWRKTFGMTLSFADGAAARDHAIRAALRAYKPTYIHCWQLKTFWHESKIVDSDMEIHSFEEMETLPPMITSQLTQKDQQTNTKSQSLVLQVVEEMKTFRNEMGEILKENHNDIRRFWLRKTQKPVLAVLAVDVGHGKIQLYRGTNMEVSMPTGSLCAERNAIGTALANHPSLKRQDLKMIAVLSVAPPPLIDNTNSNTNSNHNNKSSVEGFLSRTHSAASLIEWLDGNAVPSAAAVLQQQQQQQQVEYQRRQRSSSIEEEGSTNANTKKLPKEEHEHPSSIGISPLLPPMIVRQSPTTHPITEEPAVDGATILPPLSLEPSHHQQPATSTSSSTPVRRINLYSHNSQKTFSHNSYLPPPLHDTNSNPTGEVAGSTITTDAASKDGEHNQDDNNQNGGPSSRHRGRSSSIGSAGGTHKTRKMVVVHSEQDINPLKPCGACMEWLKKIAESNPYFQILTFTDVDCNGVYCTPCEDE